MKQNSFNPRIIFFVHVIAQVDIPERVFVNFAQSVSFRMLKFDFFYAPVVCYGLGLHNPKTTHKSKLHKDIKIVRQRERWAGFYLMASKP